MDLPKETEIILYFDKFSCKNVESRQWDVKIILFYLRQIRGCRFFYANNIFPLSSYLYFEFGTETEKKQNLANCLEIHQKLQAFFDIASKLRHYQRQYPGQGAGEYCIRLISLKEFDLIGARFRTARLGMQKIRSKIHRSAWPKSDDMFPLFVKRYELYQMGFVF